TGPHTQSLCVRGGSDRPLCQFALNVLSQLDESGDMTAERIAQATRWRRHLHQIPGTEFDVGETADFVARTCTDLGWEVTTGIGGSGVVASLTRGTSPRSIALRADMDGLPIEERTGAAHASKNIGAMHACGHDGHMAMVLGAASALAADIAFDGTVRLGFQPAEEPGTGAEAMIADGLFDRFAIDEIYGLHNIPGLPAGEIHTRCGPIMAAEDNFEISITGRGGHASAPHFVIDPMVIGAEVVLSLQTIVARNVDPPRLGRRLVHGAGHRRRPQRHPRPSGHPRRRADLHRCRQRTRRSAHPRDHRRSRTRPSSLLRGLVHTRVPAHDQ